MDSSATRRPLLPKRWTGSIRGLSQAQLQGVYLMVKSDGRYQSMRRRTGPGFPIYAGEVGACRQSARQLLVPKRQTSKGNLE
jgi:hypothetical protein